MSFEKIRQPVVIPYFDDKEIGLIRSLINGGRSRNISPIIYAFRRLRNYLLMLLAYITPINKIRVSLNRMKGINIGENVYIGMFCFLDNVYPEYIYIEDNAGINTGTMILAHFNFKSHFRDIITPTAEPVIIREGALVAVRCIILPGVTIGSKSIVSAGSVVNKSIPSYTLVTGNPAKKITTLKIQ